MTIERDTGGAAFVPPTDCGVVQQFRSIGELEASIEAGARVYGQEQSQTVARLESVLGHLEGGERADGVARVTASGSIAQLVVSATLVSVARPRVVLVRPCYEGTEELFTGGVPTVELICVDYSEDRGVFERDLRAATTQQTAMVWVEALTNPCLAEPDVRLISSIAGSVGASCVVDATVATPYLVKPLQLGATAVVHSLTKSLNGHSDVCGGVAVLDAISPHAARFKEMARRYGGSLSPSSAALLLRSLRTASLRVERASSNAASLAASLEKFENLTIHYPSLGGSLLGINFEGGKEMVERVVGALRSIPLVPSFGDVSTTVAYPHAGHGASCTRVGCSPGLLRISVGIEPVTEIIDEMQFAIAAARGSGRVLAYRSPR